MKKIVVGIISVDPNGKWWYEGLGPDGITPSNIGCEHINIVLKGLVDNAEDIRYHILKLKEEQSTKDK